MRKIYYFICLSILTKTSIEAQNVGINTAGTAANASSILDLNTGNSYASPNGKGVLFPNVALTGTGDATTVTSPATSLWVYNTATAGAGATAVTPGYYYWDGTKWVSVSGNAWLTVGNAGTTAGTNFLGTTDNQDLVLKTNGTEWVRVRNMGNVGVNTSGALPTSKLQVNEYYDTTIALTPFQSAAGNLAGISVYSTTDFIGMTTVNRANSVSSSDNSDAMIYWGDNPGKSLRFAFMNYGIGAPGIEKPQEAMRIVGGTGDVRIGTPYYYNQCGGTTATESTPMKFAVMGGFSSFGNFNNDPAVNAAPPVTTWANGVGALALGMNRNAGTSNVDFWNNSDPNNGAAALGINDRGFNFRNFQGSGGSCSENLLMTLDGSGNLTLANYAGAGGQVNAYAFNTLSDKRAKQNIETWTDDASQKIMQLKTKSYQYKNISYAPLHKLEIKEESNGQEQIGLLAQEVYTVFPQAVHKPADENNELWSIDYAKLVPLLIKGFQEQQQQIEQLKKQVEQLNNKK
ncbi:MAG: tail fiber domain-containing protein [Bacteroidetes bacterium]|nr:tail fiber domain-containing protein [Bacteroidota bacterium]